MDFGYYAYLFKDGKPPVFSGAIVPIGELRAVGDFVFRDKTVGLGEEDLQQLLYMWDHLGGTNKLGTHIEFCTFTHGGKLFKLATIAVDEFYQNLAKFEKWCRKGGLCPLPSGHPKLDLYLWLTFPTPDDGKMYKDGYYYHLSEMRKLKGLPLWAYFWPYQYKFEIVTVPVGHRFVQLTVARTWDTEELVMRSYLEFELPETPLEDQCAECGWCCRDGSTANWVLV